MKRDKPVKLDDFIDGVLRRDPEVVHVEDIPARPAQYATPQREVHPALWRVLRASGVERLYAHQAAAIDHIRGGEHTVIVTGTASGKTLCYNLPVIEAILAEPQTRALYLFPTKALAQDQLRGLMAFPDSEPEIAFNAGTYDGDTPTDLRRKLRDGANVILSNPDMLHQGILPNHGRWASFFGNLKFVVIDEIHTYRGVFGSNVSNVVRRLRRIANHYGAQPTFVLCSATIHNPVELAQGLINDEVAAVTSDGAPRGPRSFFFLNPAKLDETGMARRGPHGIARRLMVELVKRRVQTIAFSRTRLSSEVIHRYCKEALAQRNPTLAKALRAYRGGYLPEDRREIERGIKEGKILGISSTNALELGIDIGTLQACLIVGYPGTIASLWQQAGRAGRTGDRSLVVLIGHNSPIDQYLMNMPRYALDQNPENAVIDPDNPHLVMYHLRCAAQEMPLPVDEVGLFGEAAPAIAEMLVESGEFARTKRNYYWKAHSYPAADIGLRNMTDAIYTIQELGTERIIGTVDETGAFYLVHSQAVYLHDAETYFVEKLDLEKKVAFVQKRNLDYYTQAISESNIVIDEEDTERPLNEGRLGLGEVTVTTMLPMFKKIKFASRDSIGFGKLDLPPQQLNTRAVWLIPPAETVKRVTGFGRTPVDGLVGIANVLVDIARLHIMCDPSDIGTVVDSTNRGSPTLFVYDRYEGGMGFAQRAYRVFEDILEDTLALVRQCDCDDGCPSCVGAPVPDYAQTSIDSGTHDVLPDKEAALVMLHDILDKEPYIPAKPPRPPGAEPGVARPNAPMDDLPAKNEEDDPVDVTPLPDHLAKLIRQRIKRLKD